MVIVQALHGFFEKFGGKEQEGTEVEIVAHASRLIVDDGMRLPLAVLPFVEIGINHADSFGQEVGHPLQSPVTKLQR